MIKILIALVVLVILGIILFVWFMGMALEAGFENKFPMDKYFCLIGITERDENLQKQRDEFVRNAKEIKIAKNLQDLELYDVERSIDKLIYPNQKYSSLTCPDCGKNPFWILGEKLNNENKTGDWQQDRWGIRVPYYAICSRCKQIVFYYDESVYDRDVIERIKNIKQNEFPFKSRIT